MPFVIEITADSYADLQKQVLALAAGMGGTAVATPKPVDATAAAPVEAKAKVEPKAEAETKAKPKPTPKPKDEVKAEPKAEPKVEPEVDFATTVREVVLAVVDKHGREYMQEILAKYGIQRATQVAEEQRDELLTELREARDA